MDELNESSEAACHVAVAMYRRILRDLAGGDAATAPAVTAHREVAAILAGHAMQAVGLFDIEGAIERRC